jgi:hypothetical protein
MNRLQRAWGALGRWSTFALAAICLLEAGLLLWRVWSPRNSVSMTPLYRALLGETSGEADRSFALESPGVAARIAARSGAALVEPVSLEDTVNFLDALIAEGRLTLDQQRALAPLVEQAERLRADLAACQARISEAEDLLRKQANEIAAGLTDEQRTALLASRDRTARANKDTYWEALAAVLHAADKPAESP